MENLSRLRIAVDLHHLMYLFDFVYLGAFVLSEPSLMSFFVIGAYLCISLNVHSFGRSIKSKLSSFVGYSRSAEKVQKTRLLSQQASKEIVLFLIGLILFCIGVNIALF